MRLFALPDAVVGKEDRAQWLTMPFDLAYAAAPAARVLPTAIYAATRPAAGRPDPSKATSRQV